MKKIAFLILASALSAGAFQTASAAVLPAAGIDAHTNAHTVKVVHHRHHRRHHHRHHVMHR